MASEASDERLFGLTVGECKDHFKQATRDLKLDAHHLVNDQAWGGGATRNILLKRRELEEVRKRRYGRTYTSPRRYEKSGRVQKVLQLTPPAVLACCQDVEKRLGQLLTRPCGTLPSPLWGCRA